MVLPTLVEVHHADVGGLVVFSSLSPPPPPGVFGPVIAKTAQIL